MMKKWKRLFIRSSSALLATYLFLFTSVNSFAAPQQIEDPVIDDPVIEDLNAYPAIDDPEIEIQSMDMMLYATGSGSSGQMQDWFDTFSSFDWLNYNWRDFCQYCVNGYLIADDVIWENIVAFCDWLDETYGDGTADQLFEDNPEVNVDTNNKVYVPQPIINNVTNFIEYRIQQNPLSYTECSISSYNFLDASRFPSYAMYSAVKNYMKNTDGYHVIQYIGTYGNNVTECRIVTLSHSYNLGFIGTTIGGVFNNVHVYKDWVNNYNISDCPMFNASGTITNKSTQAPGTVALHNTNSFQVGNVFTSYDKNEYIYCFNNLNAYKNYNVQLPQHYYLGPEAIGVTDFTPPISGTVTDTQLTGYGSYYSSTVSQIQSGWTADEVMQLVELIMSGQGGSGGSGGSGDGSDFDLGFLGTIGRLIGSLITGIGNLLAGIAEGIVNVVVGSDGNGGIIGMLRNLISNITDLVDTDFNGFLSDIFSWLPVEIVTLFTGVIIFGLFFGILKIIRG